MGAWQNSLGSWMEQLVGRIGRDAEGNDGAIRDEVRWCESIERVKGVIGRIPAGRV